MNSPKKKVISYNDDIEMNHEDGTSKIISNTPLIPSKMPFYLQSLSLADPSKVLEPSMENSSVISDDLIPKKTSFIKGTNELAEANEGDLTETSSVVPIYEKDGLEPQEVINKDIPERIIEKYKDQIREEIIDERNMNSFAKWLVDTKFSDKISEELSDVLKLLIRKHRVEFYDTPYIATYFKKEISRVGLSSDDVYLMFSLYEDEYLKFEEEKKQAIQLFNILKMYFVNTKEEEQLFLNEYINGCKDIIELRFVNNFFDLLIEINCNDNGNVELQRYKERRACPYHTSAVAGAKRRKIDEFLSKYTLNQSQVVSNIKRLQANEFVHLFQPIEINIPPNYLSKDYLSESLGQELQLFTQACEYYALILGTHPYIKKLLWNNYLEHATISTEPTKKGMKELDINHELYKTKRILNRKVTSFFEEDNEGCDYLDIVRSEKLGLITVTLKSVPTKEAYTSLMKLLTSAVNGCLLDKLGQIEKINLQYIALRNESCKILLLKKFNQEFEERLKGKLEYYSEMKLIMQLGDSFGKLLSFTPIPNVSTKKYVLSFSYDVQTNKIFCAVINQFGILMASACYTKILSNFFSLKTEEKNIYCKEEQNITDLLKEYQPVKIILGANDLSYIKLKEILSNKVDNKEDIIYASPIIPSIYAKSEQAREDYKNIYSTSPSKKDFESLMFAISQGRCAFNMLGEVCKVYSEGLVYEDKLSLSKKQCYIKNKNLLCQAFQNEIIKRVNDNGVDLGYITIAKDFQKVLQYVSGFGEIKYNNSIEDLTKISLKSRLELKKCFPNKEKLYENCVSFFIFRSDLIYDSMRLLPSQYNDANKILMDLFGNVDIYSIFDRLYNSKTDSIILKEEDKGKYDSFILNELINPFGPSFPRIAQFSKEDVFDMMTNHILSLYSINLFTVINNDSEKKIITCVICNTSIIAHILYEEIEDSTSLYKENYTFKAMIKSISIEDNMNYSIMLTRKKEEIDKLREMLIHSKEYINFDFSLEDSITLALSENKQKYASFLTYKKINKEEEKIFFNENYWGAIARLRKKQIGESLFRPSILGPDYYTLSYKVEEGLYNHIQIKNTGSALVVDNHEYLSLSEIQMKFMNPICQFLKGIKNHSKYAVLPRLNEFKKKLIQEKELEKVNRRKIFYHLSYLEHYPQYLVLGYTPTAKTTAFEYIKITSNGLLFHDLLYANIDNVISYFRDNYGKESYFLEMKKMTVPESNIEDITMEMALTKFEGEDPNINQNKEGYRSSLGNKGYNRYDNSVVDKNKNENQVWGSNTNTNDVGAGWATSIGDNQNDLGIIKVENNNSGLGTTNNVRDVNNGWGESISNNQNGTSNHTEEPIKKDKQDNSPIDWGVSPIQNPSINDNTPNTNWGVQPQENNNSTNQVVQSPTDQDKSQTNKEWGNNNNETTTWGPQPTDSNNNNHSNISWNDNNNNGSSWKDSYQNNNFQNKPRKQYNKEGGRKTYDNNREGGRKYNNFDRGNRGGDRGRGGRGRGRGRGRGGYNNYNRNDNGSSSEYRNDESNQGGWTNGKTEDNPTSGWEHSTEKNNNESSNLGTTTVENKNEPHWDTSDNKETAPVMNWGNSNDNTTSGWGTLNVPQAKDENKTSTNVQSSSNEGNINWGQSNIKSEDNNWGTNTITEEKTNQTEQPNNNWGTASNDNQQNCNWGNSNSNDISSTTNNNQQANNWGQSETNQQNTWKLSSNDNQQSSNWGNDKNWNDDNNKSWNGNSHGDKYDRGARKKGCFNCGEEGHQSKDCPQPKKEKSNKCFNCGEEGHKSRDCPQPKKERTKKCFNCGEEGHLPKDCPNQKKERKNQCFNCGQEGHQSRDCPNPKKERKNQCFKCGQEGHQSRECPNNKRNNRGERKGPIKCYNCGEEGHTSRYCPNPKQERKEGRRDNDFNKWKTNDTKNVGWGGKPSSEKEEGELQETPKDNTTSQLGGVSNDNSNIWSSNNNNTNGWGTGTDIKTEIQGWDIKEDKKEEPPQPEGWGTKENKKEEQPQQGWGTSSSDQNIKW